jgi:hypothetical protein
VQSPKHSRTETSPLLCQLLATHVADCSSSLFHVSPASKGLTWCSCRQGRYLPSTLPWGREPLVQGPSGSSREAPLHTTARHSMAQCSTAQGGQESEPLLRACLFGPNTAMYQRAGHPAAAAAAVCRLMAVPGALTTLCHRDCTRPPIRGEPCRAGHTVEQKQKSRQQCVGRLVGASHGMPMAAARPPASRIFATSTESMYRVQTCCNKPFVQARPGVPCCAAITICCVWPRRRTHQARCFLSPGLYVFCAHVS